MANVFFKKGLLANLPASYSAGTFYVTTDERAMYLDIDDSTRIRLGDFIQVAAVANLPTEGASTSALYYCVAENILAKWNGSDWTQINKQPTAEEMKTLLGLGSLAYKSEVAEGDLNADLAAKINAASGAQHSHTNKDVIDGITAEKVAAWDASEGNAKTYADGLNTAMNTRVEALEAIDHEHTNKALLDTYTQTEADLADAVAKKHAHTFNEVELNKIAEGDVAKWNAVVADHLDSEDETALKNLIKEAKQAGTDANTNIESYKVTNDARVLAVEEDVAEITNAENGILAQAKSYSDGKLATARTEISAEIDADVKVVADDLAGYKTSNNEALAGVKATAEAAATKEYTDAELAKKVDKVEGKSLVSDTEITKLASVSEGANKVEASVTNGSIKIDGVETVVYTHPDKHTIDDVTGLQDALDGKQAAGNYSVEGHKHVKADITDFTHTHTASEITDLDTTIKAYDYATKTELGDVDAKFANYKTAEAQKAIDDEQDRRLGVIEGDYVKAADIANFETKANVKKVADDLAAYVESNDAAVADRYTKAEADGKFALIADAYNDAEVRGLISDNADAIAAEKERAEAAEAGLQTQINTIMNNPDAEGAINSINEFTQYVKDHGTIADGFRVDIDKNKEDIAANAKAIEDEAARADAAEKALAGRLDTLEAIDHEAYVGADATLKSELQGEIATAIEGAKTDASNKDAVVLAESQAYTNNAIAAVEGKVTELSGNTYTKDELFTKDEVNAAIEAAVTAATQWGEF